MYSRCTVIELRNVERDTNNAAPYQIGRDGLDDSLRHNMAEVYSLYRGTARDLGASHHWQAETGHRSSPSLRIDKVIYYATENVR